MGPIQQFVDDLRQDARVAVRALRRRPVFAFAAILTLAFGIGANTAVFSAAYTLLLQPLPFAEPDRLVAVWPESMLSNQEVAFLRENSRTMPEVGSFSPGWLVGLTGVERPTQLDAGRVSGNLFELLGAQPILGRTFQMLSEQPGAPPLAVLSENTWRTQFGADPAIIGRSILLDGEAHTVTGVMPAAFEVLGYPSDLWLPRTMNPASSLHSAQMAFGLARLAPGVELAAAQSELRSLIPALRQETGAPATYGIGASVVGMHEVVTGDMRTVVFVLAAAAGFILLIAAANVANLMLVRATERHAEFAVRSSLGAAASRIARQVLMETAVLATLGALCGLAIATVGVYVLRNLLPPDTPRLSEVGLSRATLMLCAISMAAAAALFSVAPLMTALRGAQARSLRSDRTVTRDGSARGVLVAAEVALAIVLLTGATLMGRTLASLYAVDPGFNASQLMTLRVQPPASRSPSQLPAYWSEVLANVRAVPGVTSAATVLHLPMSGRKWQAPIEVEGLIVEPELQTRAAWQVVQGDYLETIGGTLLAGRSFTTADGDSASRVAMISQTLATRVFGAADPLGRRIRAGNATQGNWVTIVGVVSDIRHDSLSAAPPPELYVPFGQRIIYATSLIARTSVDPASLALPLQRAVWAIDASTPIALVKPMQELIDESVAARRFVLGILIAFAALGVALGAIGIYGVVSYGVRQRTREIGVRMALGAAPRAVVALVVQHGMMWAAIGTAAGLAMALLLARYMRSLLFGVATTDTLTFVLVPTTLLVVAAAAAALPALRAARLQPTIALRD